MVCPSCGAENDDVAEVCFSCRSVVSAVTRGTILGGRYEILDTLGRGGMGIVFKAHDRRLDEIVAIKLLRNEISHDPEMARRLLLEIKLARRVTHPNVCRIHEFGEDDAGRSFFAMECVDGVDLKKLVGSQGGLPPSEAYDLAEQTTRGLEAIHKAGIVHRDLKTANIMRDNHGKVRLMDFGIAKQTGGLTGSIGGSRGVVVGTPEYMSPEQAFGEKADFRSDIYALGIVVFELFTGQVPFKSDSPAVTLLMHLQEQPTLDGAVAARVPGALIPLLRRALAKEPGERYQSCEEMLHDLTLAAAGASHPTPTPLVAPGVGRTRRLPKRGILVGALAVALATGVGVGLVLRPSSEGPEPKAENAKEEWPVPATAEPSDPGESPPVAGERAGAEDSTIVSPSLHTQAATRPVATETGELRVGVLPWAEVSVNGVRYGITPLPPLELAPGRYVIRLVHSGYKPILRKVTIRSDEVTQLNVDLGLVGIPK